MVIQARLYKTILSCFIEFLLFTYQTVSATKQDNSDSNSRKKLMKSHHKTNSHQGSRDGNGRPGTHAKGRFSPDTPAWRKRMADWLTLVRSRQRRTSDRFLSRADGGGFWTKTVSRALIQTEIFNFTQLYKNVFLECSSDLEIPSLFRFWPIMTWKIDQIRSFDQVEILSINFGMHDRHGNTSSTKIWKWEKQAFLVKSENHYGDGILK